MSETYNFTQIQKLMRNQLKQVAVTLPASGWSVASPYTQTIALEGVTATNIVISAPEPTKENLDAVGDNKVLATGQNTNELTFTAFEGKPTVDLTYYILLGGEG